MISLEFNSCATKFSNIAPLLYLSTSSFNKSSLTENGNVELNKPTSDKNSLNVFLSFEIIKGVLGSLTI